MSEETKKPARKRAAKRQRRERGRLHLTQDKRSGIWQVRGTVRGIRVRESSGTSDALAADAIRVKMEAELLEESVHGKKKVMTFGECVTYYVGMKNPDQQMRKRLAVIVARFGDTRVSEIDTKVVHSYADEAFANYTGVSRNASIIIPMKAAINAAARAGMCAPANIQKYAGDSAKVVSPGDDWITEFLAKCTVPKFRAYVTLLTTTGCRGAEACKLRTENVDYVQQTALIEKTKNGDPRTLELTEPLIQLLKSFPHGSDGSVFGWGHTQTANREIRKYCKRNGLTYYSGHKFGRHALAERLLDKGWTLKEVADAVGWKSYTVLHKRYGHLEKSKLSAKLRDAATSFARGSLRVVNGGK